MLISTESLSSVKLGAQSAEFILVLVHSLQSLLMRLLRYIVIHCSHARLKLLLLFEPLLLHYTSGLIRRVYMCDLYTYTIYDSCSHIQSFLSHVKYTFVSSFFM